MPIHWCNKGQSKIFFEFIWHLIWFKNIQLQKSIKYVEGDQLWRQLWTVAEIARKWPKSKLGLDSVNPLDRQNFKKLQATDRKIDKNIWFIRNIFQQISTSLQKWEIGISQNDETTTLQEICSPYIFIFISISYNALIYSPSHASAHFLFIGSEIFFSLTITLWWANETTFSLHIFCSIRSHFILKIYHS